MRRIKPNAAISTPAMDVIRRLRDRQRPRRRDAQGRRAYRLLAIDGGGDRGSSVLVSTR
jgi:hypothetical protein